MPTYREFRFEIDANYTAETMPLKRLAQYLRELAVVLGEDRDVHLMKVESASTVPVFLIEEQAAERVRARAAAVKRGVAPAKAMESYRKLNQLLQDDHGHAVLIEDTAEIIPFPGARGVAEPISGILQQGSIEGELENVGGPGNWVPVHLRTMANERISGCFAKKALSQELGHFMYQPVRLYGRGQWGRSSQGKWAIERFYVDGFNPLKRAPLSAVVANLRRIKSNWDPNAIATLDSLRHGNGEDE